MRAKAGANTNPKLKDRPMTDTHPETKLWDLIEKIRTTMLVTRSGDCLESRPMSAYPDRDAKRIYFITPMNTDKTHEIAEGDTVNLAFADTSGQNYVSVEGHARVLQDVALQKKLWNAFAEAWLPQGPEAPDVGLIEVTPSQATYWDSPSLKLVQLWQVAVANVTQTPPSGEVQTVTL